MVSNSDSIVVSPAGDVTTANVSDKPCYLDVISCLSSETIKKINYMVEDPSYDDQQLCDLSLRDFSLFFQYIDTENYQKKK
jgi:hypothetical protein